jgi:hypothetical protein
MVYDSTRNKFVIFGGRANSGYDLADTWEWDPGTGAFTNRTASVGPSARSQHSMVFEKSTGKVLLFGGGLAGSTSDQTSISLAFGDTWEWDAGAGTWNQLNPTSAPGARYDSALIWDSKRNRAVLFGGMQKPQADVDGIPQNDVWEWDPAKASWTLRPSKGTQPTARWGHAMAYDPGRGMAVLAGGKDLDTNLELADLWDWDPNSATWTQRLDGSEPNLPAARMYASLVTAQNRLDLLAGLTLDEESGKEVASRELWALDPASATFTNRSVIQSGPSPRGDHSIAFCPATGKTYIFGGGRLDTSAPLNDLWEWDGSSWSEVQADVRPPARGGAAIAYDPYRKSLVIFAGCSTPMSFSDATECFYDTWEWQSSTRKWTQLFPATSPDYSNWNGNSPPQMVTDSGRGKLLLFGVAASNNSTAVWEWDGATTTWTNRTPTPGSVIPKFYDPKTNSSDASTSVTWHHQQQRLLGMGSGFGRMGIPRQRRHHQSQLQSWRGLRQPAPSASAARGGSESNWQHDGPRHLGAGSQGADLVPAHFPRRLSRRGLLADGLRQQAWRDGAVLHARGWQFGRDRDLGVQSHESRQWRGVHRRHGVDLRLGLLRGRRVLRKRGLLGHLPILQRRRLRRHLHRGGRGNRSSWQLPRTGVRQQRQLQRKERHGLLQRQYLRLWLLRGWGVL